MKKAVLFFLVFSFSVTVFGQEKPLTQAEYVKMLYSLDKDFGTRANVVEALRRRGIDFVVTDGLRSLTRSKGRNDDELKRAFEEAGRRRAGGGAVAKPLSEKESADVIAQARSKTLEAVAEMPDFVVKQQIPGFFRDFTGTVTYDAKDPSKSLVNFTAKVASIDTGVANRDNHLRNADFFEVEKYPDLTFKSTKVEKQGNGWAVTGDLTMKGVTKSVTIPFNLTGFLPGGQRSGPRMGITGSTTVNRRDFGINWGNNIPGTQVPVVADNVDIVLQIEAVQPRATPAATPTPAE